MTKYFSPKKIKEKHASPGRIYADMFLYEKLEEIIPQKEIKVLDIGCGSGYVRKIFSELGYKINYTGVDVKKHSDFEKYNQYAITSELIESKIEDFQTDKKFDLVFSICALEHIKDDISAVSKTWKFLKPKGIQIHIVPTFWSLFLYLWHGYRQYTPALLEKMFKEKDFRMYRLGGLFSFFLHLLFITIPEILLGTAKARKFGVYSKLVNISNKLDYFFPILPSFYAVIIKD